jgi:predicted enzyme related to lactoylglutathione lyase
MAGTLVHYELAASDTGRAKDFYAGLFGWSFRDSGMPGIDYQLIEGEPGGALYQAPIVAGCKDLDGNQFSLFQSDESAPAPSQ